ncbi:VOC family protein [Rhodococcus sp. GA1]|uniref:VOC family protein n=1 Tax=Rhodococcus sp. GA1 TaxID=2942275 RepID=UPI0020CDE931|nr:VOC family protein [Rhodococcus sp. GA1]
MIPRLAGVHHVKLPVSDLSRSTEWYQVRLGYEPMVEFRESDELVGLGLRHPDGGPMLALRLDPEKAKAAAGFDYFSIGVPDKAAMEDHARHLDELGEQHGGVHFASIGWILPLLHDPDGHEVRFYTVESHTEVPRGTTRSITDPRETAEAHERNLPSG